MEEKVWEGDERVVTRGIRDSQLRDSRVTGGINQSEGRHGSLVR